MIYFRPEPLQQMKNDATQSFPNECCGFMFGTIEGEIRTVVKILEVNNVSQEDQRRRFLISPLDYLKAENYAEENNLGLIGIYHSHPNHPSIPSETDRLAAQPVFSYVIVSVMNGEISTIQSWLLNDESVFEEEKFDSDIKTRIHV